MAEEKAQSKNAKYTLLVAEDDDYLSRALVDKLQREGFTVVAATNGQDALKKLEEENIDVMLLDIIMPKMNGFEVLEAAKQHKTKVIVLSNLGQETDVTRAKELGALEYYINTDISLQDVVKKLTKHLK